MAPLTPHSDLAIAEIAFYSPALILSLIVTLRHGFGRSLGWFYLVTLSVLRLIGGSCELYSVTQNDYSTGLLEVAAITSAIGTAPLLLALEGLLMRVNTGLQIEGRQITSLPFNVIRLGAVLGLVLAIVGGVNEPTSPTVYKQGDKGTDLIQAASIIFLIIYLVLALLTLIVASRKDSALSNERILVYAGLASLPFLLVRVIYTVLVAFFVSDDFFYRDVNVYIQAFMQFAMEAIVVVLFVAAGIMVPKADKPALGQRDVEGMPPRAGGQGYVAPTTAAPREKVQRPERNLGDYRPSRMIRNALRGE